MTRAEEQAAGPARKNMISTAQVVEEIVKTTPFLEYALARDIVSYSALARDLREEIKKKLLKDVKRGAIVMALKRVSVRLKKEPKMNQKIALGDLTVRLNLVGFSFINSTSMAEKQHELFSAIKADRDIFCNLAQGVRETTFIVSRGIAKKLENIFAGEKLVAKIDGLSSVTLLLPRNTVERPGVYYAILKLLAWEGINVIEIISTHNELTLVVKEEYVNKAFALLKSYT